MRSRLWAQPPIRLPPQMSRLMVTLPILPAGSPCTPVSRATFAPSFAAPSRACSSRLRAERATAEPIREFFRNSRRSRFPDMRLPHLKEPITGDNRPDNGPILPLQSPICQRNPPRFVVPAGGGEEV